MTHVRLYNYRTFPVASRVLNCLHVGQRKTHSAYVVRPYSAGRAQRSDGLHNDLGNPVQALLDCSHLVHGVEIPAPHDQQLVIGRAVWGDGVDEGCVVEAGRGPCPLQGLSQVLPPH